MNTDCSVLEKKIFFEVLTPDFDFPLIGSSLCWAVTARPDG